MLDAIRMVINSPDGNYHVLVKYNIAMRYDKENPEGYPVKLPQISFVYITKDKNQAYKTAHELDSQVMYDFSLGVVVMADAKKVISDGGHYEPANPMVGYIMKNIKEIQGDNND
jgi:hypothetical protein